MKDAVVFLQVLALILVDYLLRVAICVGLSVGLLLTLQQIGEFAPSMDLPAFPLQPDLILFGCIFFGLIIAVGSKPSSSEGLELKDISCTLNGIDNRLGQLLAHAENNDGLKDAIDQISQSVYEIEKRIDG